ncbi:MAG TPA: LamG-like jellyroll fold domain-containing protein, partial [Chitinophagaceae bacterium]
MRKFLQLFCMVLALLSYGNGICYGIQHSSQTLQQGLHSRPAVFNSGDTVTTGAMTGVPVAGLGAAITLESSRSEGLDVLNHSSLQWGQSSFTVEGWVKKGNGASFYTIAAKQNVGGGTGWFFRFNGNKLSFATVGAVTNYVDGITDINDNSWHHVAAVMDATSKTLTLYIDGAVEKTAAFTTAANINNTQKLGVGYKPNYGEYFNGSIDEVRIWTVARTTAQLNEYRNTPLTGTESNLVACWSFEEGSGTAVTDLTANANNGTLLNTDADEWITGNITYTRSLNEDNAITLRIGGSEPGNPSGVTALVSQLPQHGKIFQTNDGVTESTEITATGTQLVDAGGNPRRLIYKPFTDYNGSDNFSYQVTNGTTNSANTETVNLTVTAVDDPPVITSNGGAATASISLAENLTAVTTVTATDADAGTSIVYSITGGADAAKFSINGSSGALVFVVAPDFETPADADANNNYEVTVRASDGTNFDEQTITVTVTNENDNTPVIT